MAAPSPPRKTAKHPQDIIYRGFNWQKLLQKIGTGVGILDSNWIAEDEGITIVNTGTLGPRTQVRISGGTAGRGYRLRNHVTLSNGEEYNRIIVVDVKDNL